MVYVTYNITSMFVYVNNNIIYYLKYSVIKRREKRKTKIDISISKL